LQAPTEASRSSRSATLRAKLRACQARSNWPPLTNDARNYGALWFANLTEFDACSYSNYFRTNVRTSCSSKPKTPIFPEKAQVSPARGAHDQLSNVTWQIQTLET